MCALLCLNSQCGLVAGPNGRRTPPVARPRLQGLRGNHWGTTGSAGVGGSGETQYDPELWLNCPISQAAQTFGPIWGWPLHSPFFFLNNFLSSLPPTTFFTIYFSLLFLLLFLFCLSFPSGPLKGSSPTPLDPWRSLRGPRHLLAHPLMCCYFSFNG